MFEDREFNGLDLMTAELRSRREEVDMVGGNLATLIAEPADDDQLQQSADTAFSLRADGRRRYDEDEDDDYDENFDDDDEEDDMDEDFDEDFDDDFDDDEVEDDYADDEDA